MTDVLDGPARDSIGHAGRGTVFAGAAEWLSLAATPTFAAMALLTGVLGAEKMAMICGGTQQPVGLGGMAPMYWLMSAVHLAPWLKLIAKRSCAPAARPLSPWPSGLFRRLL